MLKYKMDVGDALERAGYNTYKAKTIGPISQSALKRIKNEDSGITLKTLNDICNILDLQPKDILEFVRDNDDEEKIKRLNK
ncbi:MAG: helix-turn-helix domain-containing protein [Firmicutes bacterium]|nr:helix-turn-helix domain-containing protein [Bacillota bacterium]